MRSYVPTAFELACLADTLFQDAACNADCVTNECFTDCKQTAVDRCVAKKLVYEEACTMTRDKSKHYRLTVRGRDALRQGFERYLRFDVDRMRP
jgi:hypothetical protein